MRRTVRVGETAVLLESDGAYEPVALPGCAMTDHEYVSVPGPLLALPLRPTVAWGIAVDEKKSPLKDGFANVRALLELAPAFATTPDPVLRM